MTKKINPKILGGWLILVQAYIIFDAVMWVKNAQLFWGLVKEREKLTLALGNNPNAGMYNIFMYYELITSVIFMIMLFILFYIFFKKWKVFPQLMIITLAGEIIVESFSFFYFGPISGYQQEILQKLIFSIAIAALLIVYLKISRRVKMTFVL